jgi:short-subunit dehydrogenase
VERLSGEENGMPQRVRDQVVVITGASSGIGRETAILFGEQKASVVLAARNEAALGEVKREIERLGGQAHVVTTDVAVRDQVERLARAALDRFGRIDTWINNAAVSVYATAEQLSVEEIDRVIQVNLMGPIYGMKAVLPHLRRQGYGTIINVGSVESKRSVPLQAPYVAAKHGLKGFTDTLRLELDHEQSGITVTLILPSSINTPLFNHARSKLGVKPQPIPPIYEPRAVAEAILFAAEHPRREVVVGGSGKLLVVAERINSPLVDRYMLQGGRLFRQQRTNEPDDGRDNLFAPLDGEGSATGQFGQRSQSNSLFTRHLELHPNRQRALLGTLLLGLLALVRRTGR